MTLKPVTPGGLLKDDFSSELEGLLERFGSERFHPTVGAAVDAYLAEHAIDWKP